MPHPMLLFLWYARRIDRNLIRDLRDGDAVDPESAVPLGRVLGPVESNRLWKLTERGIVRQTRDGRFYLDQALWLGLHERSKRWANTALVIVILAWILSVVLG